MAPWKTRQLRSYPALWYTPKKRPANLQQQTQTVLPPPPLPTKMKTQKEAPLTSNALASSSVSSFMLCEKQKSTARATSTPPQRLNAAAAHASSIPMPTSAPTDSGLSGTTTRLAAPTAAVPSIAEGTAAGV